MNERERSAKAEGSGRRRARTSRGCTSWCRGNPSRRGGAGLGDGEAERGRDTLGEAPAYRGLLERLARLCRALPRGPVQDLKIPMMLMTSIYGQWSRQGLGNLYWSFDLKLLVVPSVFIGIL